MIFKALVTAGVLATALATHVAADELVPSIARGTPALQTLSGRASLCRAYLETRAYPYSYLHKRAGWGVVRTCAAQLHRAHRSELRRT